MVNDRLIRRVAACLLTAAVSLSHAGAAEQARKDGDSGAAPHTEIGTVDFRVSCEQAVVDKFDRALGLLHHMMYVQSRAQFKAIAEADPECAMAYWGMATTLFQPLWPERPDENTLKRGWRLTQKAMELRPATERERLLVEATAAFFRQPETAEYWERIRRWAEGMANAYRANPDDLDTAALYGLSRLSIAQLAEDRQPLHDEAEKVLREVWSTESTHPGAIHYTIHATDAAGRAENALDIVREYGEIAPTVPHALHMPSHIYVRLGDWPAVIDWNQRSANAALREPVDRAVSYHYLHAADYLLYAYLQQGEDDKAKDVLDEAMGKDKHQVSFISAFHSAAMPARYAIERRHWVDAMALEPRTPRYLPWDEAKWPEALIWYARGLGGVHGGDLGVAREAEQRLSALRDQAKADDEDAFATYIEVNRRILAGWIARSQGDSEKALRLVRSAAELEATVEKHPVTPGALLPPYEALGKLLMEMDRPVEALEAYRRSDEVWPNRYNTLLEAARAATEADNEAAAQTYYSRLLKIAGDSKRAGVSEARKFLGTGSY